ncbi:hypothetical protein [Natrialba sp. SSL1]|uniref:hypothetical protein n=1 Tax=Natrialba sp. SSL1 TaxID=1869245 RepID=UPI000A3F4399|nr:hypothetical protein [Natrialba sp. SSL1]
MSPGIDWESIFWETRGFLGLEDDEPISRTELLETAKANGWSESEFRQALSGTDAVEFANGVGSGLQFVGTNDTVETDDGPSTGDIDGDSTDDRSSSSTSSDDLERVDLELSSSSEGYPTSLREDGQRWLLWQYRDDRKIPRNPRWGHSEDDEATAREWSLAGAKDPRAWFEFSGAERWTDHDELLGLAYYLVAPDRDDWDDDEKYDWVDVDEDVPNTRHVGLADFDNIRDPDTGEIAPKAVPWLERFGVTFCEWSPSGTGAHALGSFTLPEDAKELHIDVSDDEWPDAEIEVYPGRRYTTVTGDKIPGSADDIEDVQVVIDALVDEHPDAVEEESSSDGVHHDYTPAKSRKELAGIEITHDYDDVIDAVNQLKPSDLPLSSTYVADENNDFESWDPGYRNSSSGRSLKHVGDGQFIDMKKMHTAFGVLRLFAAEQNIISDPWDDLKKSKFRDAVERARNAGAPIPKYEPPSDGSGDGRAVSALPIGLLDALEPDERRRYAKKRGLEWPSTDDAREELFETIADVIRNEDERIVDAPTSLGKSYTIASTRWGAREDITGDRPVVHLLETRDARDEAVDVAEEHGGKYHVLLGRHEACPVCAGEHDDEITINGDPASDWLDAQCEGKGMPFSAAHRYLEEHNDQGVELPCGGDRCTAITQWEKYREGPDGELDYWPLVIATHNFAFAPGLRSHNNVVVDEEPSYEQDDLSTSRIRDAIGAYLREIDAPVTTWEAFIQLSLHDDYQGDAARERDALEDVLWTEPDRDWYFECPDAHTLAPALARAIFRAEDRANGRRFGKTGHEPPRLEAGVRDDDDWNREWVSVVLDENNDVQTVRTVPDFGAARSVVGLDAHPAVPLWQANTVPWIKTTDVLESEARQLWRRYERGLRVVQVGDATRPLSGDKALEWLNEDKLEVLLDQLVDEYGTQFRTAITTGQVEDRLEELMEEAGCHRPELMHFGEEKSRNDFEHERVGLVNGCMDPGDDYVLDLLAELDLEAEVETAVDDAGEEYRARGRGFEGADADTAQEILASVRENHIAQAAGRYARDPTDPDVTATVFVRTDAMPAGFADVQTPGVEWVYSDLQEAIVDELRSSHRSRTARELADAVDCSKEHVRQTLERLVNVDAVQAAEGLGSNGATLYSESGLPHTGVADIQESPTDTYVDSSRWALAIRDPTTPDNGDLGPQDGSSNQPADVWDWEAGPDPSD